MSRGSGVRTVLLVVVLIIIGSASIGNDLLSEDKDSSNKDSSTFTVKELTDIFDVLELPEIKDKKFIIFNTGGYYIHDNYYDSHLFDDTESKANKGEIQFIYVIGWLISENNEEIHTLSSNLNIAEIRINKELPNEWEKYKDSHPKDFPLPGCYKELDYQKFCADHLAGVEKRYSQALRNTFIYDYSHISEYFIYAFWALKRDLVDLSNQLIQYAQKFYEKQGIYGNPTIHQFLVNNLALNFRELAIHDANGYKPRSELVKKWSLLTKLPKNEYSVEAKNMIDLYKKMIEEDKDWKELSEENLKNKMPSFQAKYWIHKLRDLNTSQISIPGSCSVLDTFPRFTGESINPAEELKKLDFDAIPLLIEHMDDPRPTRCIGYMRFEDKSYLLFFGDACRQIFSAITGVDLDSKISVSDKKLYRDEPSEAKQTAQKWWDELQKKGIKQFCTDEVNKGGKRAEICARQLLRNYPSYGLGVIALGIKNAKNDYTMRLLFSLLGTSEGEAIEKFLLAQAQSDNTLIYRVSAAEQLFELGRKEGLEIGIKEMDKYDPSQFGWGVVFLIKFLCLSNEPTAMISLRKNFHKLNVKSKRDVIEMIDWRFDAEKLKITPNEDEKRKKERELNIEFENLLIHALEYETKDGSGGIWHEKSFSYPRTCDKAAHILQYDLKDKYEFDISDTLFKKDVQIVKMKNIWRKEHNLPELPEPTKKEIAKLSNEIEKKLVEKLHSAKNDTEIDKAIAEIEIQGLSALKPMIRLYEKLGEKHPAKEKLKNLLQKLSTIVNEVKFSKFSLSPDEKMAEVFNGLVGKQLTGELIVDVLNNYIQNKPDKSRGIIIDAYRDDDNMGFTLLIEIAKSTKIIENEWILELDIDVNKKGFSSSGNISNWYKIPLTDNIKEEFTQLTNKAMSVLYKNSVSLEVYVKHPGVKLLDESELYEPRKK